MQAVGVRVDFPEIYVINQDVIDFFPGFAQPGAGNRARIRFVWCHRVLVLLCELILPADMPACTKGLTSHSKPRRSTPSDVATRQAHHKFLCLPSSSSMQVGNCPSWMRHSRKGTNKQGGNVWGLSSDPDFSRQTNPIGPLKRRLDTNRIPQSCQGGRCNRFHELPCDRQGSQMLCVAPNST